ncbi:MAG: hypothetical protein MJZ74_10295 [Muribaculaceae bacterium]|nr:hypothetical protein [Muribaculaceae bacterium]
MVLTFESPFKVPAGTYMKRVFAMWLSRHAWWLLLLVAVCASLCAVDVKWSVISFILFLAALMMVMSLVYFNYAFSPLARWSVMEKTIMMDGNGLHIKFDHPKMNDHDIEWGSVRSVQFRADCTVLHISHNVDNGDAVSPSAINFLLLPPLMQEQVAAFKQLYLAR